MKALPMPSLTMLWVARLYAVWIFGFDFVRWISYSNERDTVTIVMPATNYMSRIPETSVVNTVTVHHGPAASLFVTMFLSAFLVIGLLTLNRKFGRTIVGVAAVGFLSMTVYGVLHLVYDLATATSISSGFLHSIFPLILVSCFWNVVWQFVNIWLALRPPGRMNRIDRDNLPPFASPQSI